MERAPRMLTAVSTDQHVARLGSRVVDGKLSKRHEVRPVVATVSCKEVQDISNDTVDATLLVTVLW